MRSSRSEFGWSLLHALRNGLVPEIGTEEIAVGLDEQVRAVERDLSSLGGGWGGYKFISGECGTGKTFLASLISERAAERGFHFARLEVSPSDSLGSLLRRLRRRPSRLPRPLVLVIDEVEKSLLMEPAERALVLDLLRRLVAACGQGRCSGCYLVFSATPDFYSSTEGLPEPEIRLKAFNRARLEEVARRVRGLYPSAMPLDQVVHDDVISCLGDALAADAGVRVEQVPRLFLKAWVDLLDRADQHPDFQPLEFLRRGLKSVIQDDLQPDWSRKIRPNATIRPWH